MQWVQQNIADFGGNPDNVTLFGESAGGSSIHIHTISSKSRKLFHKSICQSGTALMEWVRQSNAEEKSKILARNLGCTATDSHKILEFLSSFDDFPTINKEIFKTMTADERRRGFPIVFKPSVERETVRINHISFSMNGNFVKFHVSFIFRTNIRMKQSSRNRHLSC